MATEKITDKTTLKSWFKRGLKPLESQFHAWMDSYWHKSEKIPTSSIDKLESILNSKAEANAIQALDENFEAHIKDNELHKTEKERSQLDHLADDPNATYATQQQLEELKNNPDVLLLTLDLRKENTEVEADILAFYQNMQEKGQSFDKPVFLNVIWYTSPKIPESNRCKHQILSCEQLGLNDSNNILLIAKQTEKIITYSEYLLHNDAVRQPHSYEIEFISNGGTTEIYFDVLVYNIIDQHSFNLLFLPTGKTFENGTEFVETQLDQDITGVLTESPYEMDFSYNSWDNLYRFIMIHRKTLRDNHMPPIYLRTLTTGRGNIFKPVEVEWYEQPLKRFIGFKLKTSSVRMINGIWKVLEETLDIPVFEGYGSAYTYRVSATTDNQETIIFPIDLRVSEEESQTIVENYYTGLVRKGVLFNRPVYFNFIWYSDPAKPETSMVSSQLVLCEQPLLDVSNCQNILGVKGYLPTPVKTSTDSVARCRKAEMFAVSQEGVVMVNLNLYTYVPIKKHVFNLIFIPEDVDPFVGIINHAGKDFAGTLKEHSWNTFIKCETWSELYDYLIETQELPVIKLKTAISSNDFVFNPTSVELHANSFKVVGFELKTHSIMVVDGTRCVVEEALDIRQFEGPGSAYTYRIDVTPCYPEINVVTEYPEDLSSYSDGTVFIKEQAV